MFLTALCGIHYIIERYREYKVMKQMKMEEELKKAQEMAKHQANGQAGTSSEGATGGEPKPKPKPTFCGLKKGFLLSKKEKEEKNIKDD